MEPTFLVFAVLPGDHGSHGVELIVNKVEFSIAPDSWFECETSRIEGDVDGKLFTLVVRAEMDPIGVECDDPHEMILKHSKEDVPAHLKECASEVDFIFGIHPPGKGDLFLNKKLIENHWFCPTKDGTNQIARIL